MEEWKPKAVLKCRAEHTRHPEDRIRRSYLKRLVVLLSPDDYYNNGHYYNVLHCLCTVLGKHRAIFEANRKVSEELKPKTLVYSSMDRALF